MSDTVQLSIDEFELTVFDTAYLVEVRKTNKKSETKVEELKLPDWTFRSQHAIWLTDEKVPITIRAANGEKIKKQLMESFAKRIS